MYDKLTDAIIERRAAVGVIGLGYVGLPLAVALGKAGYPVTGFEVDASKVKSIAAKKSYIGDVSTEELAALVKSGKLGATTDFSKLKKQDVIIVCVPTPLRKSKDPGIPACGN